MQRYRSPAVAELAQQLRRGPSRLRLRQLLNLEFLLSIVDSQKAYPADFVCHVLTGYPANPGLSGAPQSRLIEGSALAPDLVLLAEALSEDADLSVDDWDGALYSIADLAARFDVSTKTIFRWRRRGLVGWKFRYADRRLRVVFPERCVRRFVAQHIDLVQRGISFSQLTKDERQHIVQRAFALHDEGYTTVNAVARQIGAETGRAIETIRLILKAHDELHPAAGVFNRSKLPATADSQELAIWEAYQDGAMVTMLAERFGRPVAEIYRFVTRMRARALQSRSIEFIDSPEFGRADADTKILPQPAGFSPWKTDVPAPRRIPSDLPPYLAQLFRLPLLSKEGEQVLFRRMNYLKFKADRLRWALDPENASAAQVDEIEELLNEAGRTKNQIVQANLRLVVSLAKRHLGSGLDFFEIISDGNVSLMRAVDKFDYSRGFKFSTYASWAIMRNYARAIPDARCHSERYQTGRDDVLDHVAGVRGDDHESDTVVVMRGTIERMLGCLEERERCILRQRYGLDGFQSPQTLEQIGQRLGVSKERVRQLESRAIARLRGGFASTVAGLLGG